MLKKLRFKFVLINMVIITITLILIFGIIYNSTKTDMANNSIMMMTSLANRPLHQDAPDVRSDAMKLPYFILKVNRSGELLATGGGYYDLSDESFLEELITAVHSSDSRTGVLDEYSLRYYRADTPGDQCIVFADTSNEQIVLKNILRSSLLIGSACFIVFLGISLLLANWAVRPVDMAWRQQRQFIADASHELKTPLTVILTNAELLQSCDYDAENQARFSASILTMAQQMRGLVEQLLELARADNAQDMVVFSSISLSRLVQDCILPFEPLFFEKQLSLSADIQENIFVSGGESQLRQVVDILLDNAQKYSQPGGSVTVSLHCLGRAHCLLSVSNTGEAIAADELKNIFKRFYRVDKARSRSGGFGLGLSIAESIVTRHKGRIWAESKDGVNSFKVELPALSPDRLSLPVKSGS